MKRLTPAKVTLLMFAVIGGLIVAYVGKGLLASKPADPGPRTRDVPGAMTDLEVGTLLTDRHVGYTVVKVGDLEWDMFKKPDKIIGRVVKERIPMGKPIRAGMLYPYGDFVPLEVGEGMRAIAVSIGDSTALVDGLIKPGEYVDVHMTANLTLSSGNTSRRAQMGGGLTLTLLKGVRVITINKKYNPGPLDRNGNSVSLELTPEQANIMILARDKGQITLSFNPEGKGGGGVAVSREDRATLDEILGLDPLPEPVLPFTTEIYHGRGRQALQFRDGKLISGASRFRDDDVRGTSGGTSTQQPSGSPNDAADTPADADRTGDPANDAPVDLPPPPTPTA